MHRVTGLLALLAFVLLPPGSATSDQNDPRLGALFRRLASVESTSEAAVVEQEIWSIWLECDDTAVHESITRAIGDMNAGEHARAMRALDAIVRDAPGFAEGWNQRATLRFLMGDFDGSVQDIERVLLLEPRHFGALSGLAMIREVQGHPFEALEALEQVVRLHPHLPHLQQRIDRLTRQLGDPV